MKGKNLIQKGGEFLLYTTEDGRTRVQVRVHNESVWLSLNQLAELFQRDKSVISRHIRNIFKEGELESESTVAKFATTAAPCTCMIGLPSSTISCV